MKKITSRTTIEGLAVLVCDHLNKKAIIAVLTGGAVVTIYSKNDYESSDLDFVTYADVERVADAMAELGFERKGKDFRHPVTDLVVEFPPPPLMVGNMRVLKWATRKSRQGVLYLLAPTESVMDRLAHYYHWRDRQALDQAVMVARKNPINIKQIEKWSRLEGKSDGFREFLSELQKK